MYYNKVGTPEILNKQGDLVGSIMDDDLRAKVISTLNVDLTNLFDSMVELQHELEHAKTAINTGR